MISRAFKRIEKFQDFGNFTERNALKHSRSSEPSLNVEKTFKRFPRTFNEAFQTPKEPKLTSTGFSENVFFIKCIIDMSAIQIFQN